MGIQFFGEFLIERWVVTRGQLIEALELQEYRNLKFGELAVRRGFMTPDQVREVNELQRSTDLRFGDLAVAKGMLTPEKAREILTYQKNNYLMLGEALLELGHISEDVLERELAIFQEEQARYRVVEEVAMPEALPAAELLRAAVDLTRKLFLRVAGITVKVAAGRDADGAPEGEFHLSVGVRFTGSPQVQYVLSVSSEIAVEVASRILGQDATRESEEMVEDAVKEFTNLVCGNTAAALAQQGKDVEISPPETLPAVPAPAPGSRLVVFPLHVTEGALDLRFRLEDA
ncbi:MAG: hypothetical protein GYA21_09445 [Myxococcales bacterium]|nr:hypothetical protein [Myxococcales bacterium]